MPHDIFVSYSRRDLPSVRPIKEELEHLGFSCWMDLQGIESGSPEFTQKIAEAIIGSKVVLFFLSVHSQQSPYALNELRAARAALKRPPVLVQFNDDRMSIPFILEFGGADIIDWRKPEQKEKLLHNLREWAGTVQTGDLSAAVSKPIGTWSTGTGVIECPICGRKNLPKDTFHCRECGRDNLCLRHQDDNTYLCQDCALKKMQNPAFDKTPASAILESQKVCSSGKSDIFQNASLDSAKRKGDPSANGPLPGDVRRIDLGTVSFNLRWIPPDEPQAGFWMAEMPVTQALWKYVMGSNPSWFNGDDLPVEGIDPADCELFFNKLGSLSAIRKSGLSFRLPSSGEWDFACRAGGTGKFGLLENGLEGSPAEMAWTVADSGNKTHPVGQKKPNAWGLYDMHGNVWEWVRSTDTPDEFWKKGGSFEFAAQMGEAGRRRSANAVDHPRSHGFRIAAQVDNGEISTKIEHKAGSVLSVITDGFIHRYRWCPPGSFLMGSPLSEKGRIDREKQHRVTLTYGFWIGEVPVTEKLWKVVMGSEPPCYENGDNYPVAGVRWGDCSRFLEILNGRTDIKKKGFRFVLPTEAQWEYACRSGSTSMFGGTGNLDTMGWYQTNSNGDKRPVGLKKPNDWGLFDMHGNVHEWCSDWYEEYPNGAVTDPSGPSSGEFRVYRGGGWESSKEECRSAYRNASKPDLGHFSDGFRLVILPLQ